MTLSARMAWRNKARRDLVAVYGEGPPGATCAQCVHLLRISRSKTWSKCKRTAWTGSDRTDWSDRLAACGGFEPRDEDGRR